MTRDDVTRQRIARAVHHVNALQRLLETEILCFICVDTDGRPCVVVRPDLDTDIVQDLAAAFAVMPLTESAS